MRWRVSWIPVLILLHVGHVAARFALVRERPTLTADASRTDAFMQRAMMSDARFHLSMATAFKDELVVTVDAFAATEADMEMGSDLGIDLGLNATQRGASTGGPATLAEYCSGTDTKQEKQMKLDEGVRVRADWENYGTMYPGKISDTNRDGTVDIHYDDGFEEKRVDVDDIKIRKRQGLLLLEVTAPRDDPACQLLDFLEKVKKQVKAIQDMIAEWLGGQRAKIAGDAAVPPPPPATTPMTTRLTTVAPPQVGGAPAPAPAAMTTPPATPPTGDQADELAKLTEQLADLDEYIAELEKLVAANEKELQKYNPVPDNSAPAGITTVDGLIAQYKAKIAARDARIAELKKIIKEQRKELARLSGKQMSLSGIDAAVKALAKDVAEAEKKRDQLKKDGKLDDELRFIIDDLIKALNKLRAKVDKLLSLDANASKERKGFEDAAKAKAEAVRKKAIAEGKSPEEAEEAAEEALEDFLRQSRDTLKAADLETMKIAQDMGKDLKEAEKGTVKLDTGLHPHGDKWWRYRYEHSYIEALLMIFVSWLLLFWSEIIIRLRKYVFRKAHQHQEISGELMDAIGIVDDDTHGTVYVTWLRDFAEQMMVCTFVYLTIWIISKTVLIDYAPMLIKPAPGLRVPLTGAEYRRLALETLTIFFFAIVFYFVLMFFVARHTRKMTKKMEKREAHQPESRKSTLQRRLSSIAGYSMASNIFSDYLKQESQAGNEHMVEITKLLRGNFEIFPLGQYITLNVRLVTPFMFKFGWVMWLPTICLFLTLMLLHRFAHMGYLRVISFFTVIVLLLILGMVYKCRLLEQQIESYNKLSDLPTHKPSINKIEEISLGVLQFCLFFTCYGVARMICQTWMWELHFWPVLCLTCVAAICAALFIFLVAPTIPTFVAVMALPPYVDEHNWAQVLYISQKVAQS